VGHTDDIFLEVIVDNTLFIPWESTYTIKVDKKVVVKIEDDSEVDKKPIDTGDKKVAVEIISEEDSEDEEVEDETINKITESIEETLGIPPFMDFDEYRKTLKNNN